MAKEDYYGWVFSSPNEMLQAIFDSCHFVQGKTNEIFFSKNPLFL
jgi:hypothetical protein